MIFSFSLSLSSLDFCRKLISLAVSLVLVVVFFVVAAKRLRGWWRRRRGGGGAEARRLDEDPVYLAAMGEELKRQIAEDRMARRNAQKGNIYEEVV